MIKQIPMSRLRDPVGMVCAVELGVLLLQCLQGRGHPSFALRDLALKLLTLSHAFLQHNARRAERSQQW